MKILTVIPIARGIFKDELTYFTTQEVQRGAIVSVPVKNRLVDALVTEVKSATEVKLALRQGDFPLKKINRVRRPDFFLPQFLSAAQQAADYFAGPLGQTLKCLVPTEILSAGIGFKNELITEKRPAGGLVGEKYVIQEPDDERLTYYKGLIREEFAKPASVFLCLPTITDIKKILDSLERGIADYTIVLHHALGRTTLLENWQRALDTTHPVLVIATPSFLSLPRSDLKTLIIDRENSSAYKSPNRPFLDYRKFAEWLSSETGARLILGDIVLRTETLYRKEQGFFQPKTPIKQHVFSEAEQMIVNLQQPGAPFRILSEELLSSMDAAGAKNEKFFLFVHRRGLQPLVICQDCGGTVLCKNCEATMSLHEVDQRGGRSEENLLVCHRCGQRRTAAINCETCGGWRLRGLGLGLDLVAKELSALRPTLKIFKLDGDKIKNEKQATLLIKKFLGTPGGVLLGTELALFYLREKIENAAVVAIDSMLALPDYRINERVFSLLIRLRALVNKRFLIQVRKTKSTLFESASRGSLIDFYRQEITERKEFGYPPFRLFIKVSLAGNKEEVLLALKELALKLAERDFDTFPALATTTNRHYQLNLVIRLGVNDWPEPKLLGILKSLPPKFIVTVDPDNLVN